MHHQPFRLALTLSLISSVAACGDDSGKGTDTGESTTGVTVTGTSTSSTTDGSGGATDSGTSASTTSGAGSTSTTTGATDSGSTGGVSTGPKFDLPQPDVAPEACACSVDLHDVLDCKGDVFEACTGDQACDPMTLACANACDVAATNQQSVGCEYYSVFMDQHTKTDLNACFAVFIANTWDTPAMIAMEYEGAPINLGTHAGIPQGNGPSLTYGDFDPVAGLAPGEVVMVFLSGPEGVPAQNFAPCPKPSAVPTGVMFNGTGKGSAFKISSDVPVVAYEINPYGGGSAATTGASLLLPTSAWGTNYVAANSYYTGPGDPQMNIIAHEDNTFVTFFPTADVVGGGGILPSLMGIPFIITLDEGEHAQIIQNDELTGSIIQSNKPVGLLGGHTCFFVPSGFGWCDHGEQMIPPVPSLGHEYVGVMHRPRLSEPMFWRMVGAVDGTQLTWSSDVGGPSTLERGETAEFITGTPFVVSAQDDDHPFMLFSYMPGSQWDQLSDNGGYGDADFVISVPTAQYMRRYVFFADPTYPETNLVLVRGKKDNMFHDVDLDCLGVVPGWQAVGEYEWARVDLMTGDFQAVGNCSTGRHEISSEGPFGMWVWGWGTPLTTEFTINVSYGYPAGMDVKPINNVFIPPEG